jgi:hypothetical protein
MLGNPEGIWKSREYTMSRLSMVAGLCGIE